MTFDEIRDAFSSHVDKQSDDGFTATCPAHEDKHASLSVSRSEEGNTLVYCHAGCDTSAVLGAVNLSLSDLFDGGKRNGSHSGAASNGKHNSRPTQKQQSSQPKLPDPVVATYDYTDANGKLIFQVQRRASKKFVQRKLDGNGSWIYRLAGVERVLYHLPEIVSADPSVWIFLPEGEKDVDNLRKVGLTATTNAGGAKAPWLAGYTETLRNRRVCILPDNDEPGRERAQTVATALYGVAADVRILELPNLPEKGDVSNWLDAGGDAETLVQMVESVPVYEPVNDGDDDSGVQVDVDPLAALEAVCVRLDTETDPRQRIALQREGIDLIASIDDPFLLANFASTMPDRLGMGKRDYNNTVKAAKYAREAERARQEEAEKAARRQAAIESRTQVSHPYIVRDGVLSIRNERIDEDTGDVDESYGTIATFDARITGEITGEHDEVIYVVSGTALRGGEFTVEINSETFGSPSKLKVAIETAAGALDTVMAKMETHLGAAIKLLSEDFDVSRHQRYTRTGWIEGKFLMPGREPDGVQVELEANMPYESVEVADADAAKAALALLMKVVPDMYSPVLLASVIGPPLAAKAGLSDRRHGTFVRGQTGTFKTSTAMAFMSIWGNGFLSDENILGWGTKATANGLMHLATQPHDLPFMIDNYKPNTGGGERDFVNVIHAIMEGGEKIRMVGKVNKLRDVRAIKCWPLCTGEDMPDIDPATTARFLIVPLRKQPVLPEGLADHRNKKQLSQIGAMWLDWLESPDGEAVADAMQSAFIEQQRKWTDVLLSFNKGMPNVHRVAATLAINQACFAAATQHPVFGDALKPYIGKHAIGLRSIAQQMAGATAEGLEAYRFMNAIRELLSTGRAILVRDNIHNEKMLSQDRDKVIGWADSEGGAYLFPTMARMMVERVANVRLNDISNAAIGGQFAELGWLASWDKGKTTKNKGLGGKVEKALHVNKEALLPSGSECAPGFAVGDAVEYMDGDGATHKGVVVRWVDAGESFNYYMDSSNVGIPERNVIGLI